MAEENPFTKSNITKLKVKRRRKKQSLKSKEKQNVEVIKTNSNDTEETRKYINQMSSLERKIYEIAREELKTSFNIEKSIGYLKWKQQSNK
jgi:hypothetical protein